MGRPVEGWEALEIRALQLRSGASARVGGYAVFGVYPGRAPLAPGGGHPRSPFVGRERELVILETVLAQVTAGQGQVVGILGAAGMGKSRLLAEWRQCLAYGGATSHLPVLDLLRAHCGITEGDPLAALTAKVRLARIFATLQQMFLASSHRQPLVLTVEKLHWIDPTTEAFLTLLVESWRRHRS